MLVVNCIIVIFITRILFNSKYSGIVFGNVNMLNLLSKIVDFIGNKILVLSDVPIYSVTLHLSGRFGFMISVI